MFRDSRHKLDVIILCFVVTSYWCRTWNCVHFRSINKSKATKWQWTRTIIKSQLNSIVGFKHFKQLEKLKKFLEISELLCPLATPMVQMTAGFIAVRQSPAENRIICCFVLFRDEVN